MEIIHKRKISVFQTSHAASRKSLNNWIKVIEDGSWEHFSELKTAFSSLDYVRGLYIFNIKGNDFRLVAQILFQKQTLKVEHVFTHSEYDKWWKALIEKRRK